MKIAIIADIHNGTETRNCPLKDPNFPVVEAVEPFVERAISGGAGLAHQ